jgi:hypothetical protein
VRQDSRATAATPRRVVTVSRAKAYGTVPALLRDADVVVVAHATDRRATESIGGIPFTITTLDQVERLRGEPVAATIDLRQLGAADTSVEGATLVEPGRTYLLFLTKQHDKDGVATGRYGIVGLQAGMYVSEGDGRFARADEDSPSLPTDVSRGNVTAS